MGLNWDLSSKNIRATRVNPLSGVVHSSDSVGASNLPSLFGGTDKFFSYGISTSNISVFLEALATRKRVDLRSRPRVLVMNHRTATIIVGQEIPYLSSQQATGGGVGPISTYEFKEVAVRLEVTPHVSDDKMVFMDIHPTVKSLIEYLPANNEPVLSTREAASNVAVRDGATVVIGGLVQRNITRTWNETPYIARIPLIGWLFRQKTSDDTKNELIFLLSPSILTPEMMQEMMNSSANMLAEPRPHAGESPASKPKW
jgi:type II secretory pathway component GspD/PulD (secretin)